MEDFNVLANVFDPTNLKQESLYLENTLNNDTVIYEDNASVRSIFAPHWESKIINDFIYNNNALEYVKLFLGNEIYVHQCHINYKHAKTGGEYAWHSDYTYWYNLDGMLRPDAISVLFLLDDMTHDNGPLTVLPNSKDFPVPKIDDKVWTIKHNAEESQGIVSNDNIAKQHTTPVQLTGTAGDVVTMHANTLHYSAANSSLQSRNVLFVCYNRLDNKITKNNRPNHIVLRDFKPV